MCAAQATVASSINANAVLRIGLHACRTLIANGFSFENRGGQPRCSAFNRKRDDETRDAHAAFTQRTPRGLVGRTDNMKRSICVVAACLGATLAASGAVLVPNAYQWHMDGSTTALGSAIAFHNEGRSTWWEDSNLGAAYNDVVIGGTWGSPFPGAYCELHKPRHEFVPGWTAPDDPADPDYGEHLNFSPYTRWISCAAYASPGRASASDSSAWFSESFRITGKVWQYWLSTASSGDYAKIFVGDTLVAGGSGKFAVSGLLGPGDYRVEMYCRVDAAPNQTEVALGGCSFRIPSPGSFTLAALGAAALSVRRRRGE